MIVQKDTLVSRSSVFAVIFVAWRAAGTKLSEGVAPVASALGALYKDAEVRTHGYRSEPPRERCPTPFT